jgi:hypothetical protein
MTKKSDIAEINNVGNILEKMQMHDGIIIDNSVTASQITQTEWVDNPNFTPLQNQVIKIILTSGDVQNNCFMVMGAISGTLSMLKNQGIQGIAVNGPEALQMLLDGIRQKTTNAPVAQEVPNDRSELGVALLKITGVLEKLSERMDALELKTGTEK